MRSCLRAPWDGAQSGMPVDLQPTLVGEMLTLRPLLQDDFEDLFAVASDPLIWEQHPDSDRYTPEVFKEFFRIALESKGALIAIDAATGQVIGSSRYHGYDAEKGEVEIGWTFLARSHWGGVYNGEMKKLMLQHAFGFVPRVLFIIGAINIRSQKAIQRVGGAFIGSRLDSKGRESVVFAIDRDAAI